MRLRTTESSFKGKSWCDLEQIRILLKAASKNDAMKTATAIASASCQDGWLEVLVLVQELAAVFIAAMQCFQVGAPDSDDIKESRRKPHV